MPMILEPEHRDTSILLSVEKEGPGFYFVHKIGISFKICGPEPERINRRVFRPLAVTTMKSYQEDHSFLVFATDLPATDPCARAHPADQAGRAHPHLGIHKPFIFCAMLG